MEIYSKGLPSEDSLYLQSLVLHGIKLDLENINTLLNKLGNPHKNYLTVHVAGTNGKGSTVSIIERILRESNYTVGKFTSPHLIDLAERFQINGTPISAEELHNIINEIRELLRSAEITPTFFEFCTAIAYHWFSEKKVDWAVIEVGMGGRLDSTNVITPIVSAITNIGLEHTQYLGDTLEKIAWEKAGIIKPGVPVVTGEQALAPLTVIEDRARALNAPIWQMNRDFSVEKKETQGIHFHLNYQSRFRHWENISLGLGGSCQVDNAGVALAVMDWLIHMGYPISEQAIRVGCANVRWPGRFDLISTDPWILIDCAHNPAGVSRLVENLPEGVTVLLAVAEDKDLRAMLHVLERKAELFILTQFYGKRAFPVEKMEKVVRNTVYVPYHIESDLRAALDFAIAHAKQGKKLVITGSIYTVGQTYQWLLEKGFIDKITF